MKRRIKDTRTVAGLDIPPELLDPGHELWHNRQLHERYMRQHGWSLDLRDRFQGSHTGAPPKGRRQAAAEGFALGHGITDPSGAFPDYDRLRSLGLIE